MTRKLQLLLTTLLLTIVGATGAWAQTNISPTSDMFFRTSLSNSTYSWSSGYPKDNGKGYGTNSDEMAGNHRVGMFVLQKYEVADLDAAKSIVLHLHRVSGGDAIAVWAFTVDTDNDGENDQNWSKTSTASTMASAVNTIVGLDLNTTGTPSNTPLVNGGTNVDDSQFTITGDALTTLKAAATYSGTTGTFTLLLTNRTTDMSNEKSGDRKFYGSSTSTKDNRPYIAVEYAPAVVTENTTKTLCETLNAAFNAITTSGTITLYDDVTITSRCDVGAKTITVVPSKAGISITSSLTSSLWLLNNTAGGNLTIGSDTYQLTIGGSSVVTNSSNFLETSTKACTTLLNNVKFKNLTTTNNGGVVNQKSSSSAVLTLKNCAFENCTAPTDRGVVFMGSDDALILCGNNTFTNCSTYDVYLEKRFKIDATNGVTNTTPIRIYAQESNIKLGNAVATQSLPADEARFFIMNKDYACYSESDGSSRANLTICEGKTLDVTAAEAATLVLPFAATIPEGVSCYTLSHADGKAYATATPVETTLPAKTPVLIYASEGSYKFRNFSKATTVTSIPGSPSTEGALIGVYSELAFTTDNIASTYPDAYILNNHSTYGLGFYKAANGKKVGANRCYLRATGLVDEARGLSIVFDEEETTGIENLTPALSKGEGTYFDLSGRRVAQPTKGLYIVNGKKVVIK